MKVPNCPANIIIEDDNGNEYRCKGRYYGDGRILVAHAGKRLMVDPACYQCGDAKRLFDYDKYTWSNYRIKAAILTSAIIRNNR